MSTKYPADFDDGTTLGPTFVDIVPPTDPQRNIAAEYRNNGREAIIAVQTRVGKTDDPSTSSIDWGMLSVSGAPNQGLRFAGTHAAWPGVVGEDGIFIDSGTGNVSYHKSGDAVGVFSDLTAGGTVPTWDQIYTGDKTLDINSTPLTFDQSSTSGIGFVVSRNLASGSTTSPIVNVDNQAAGDDKEALVVTSAGGPTFATTLGGAPAGTVSISSSTALASGALGASSDVRCFAADVSPNAGDNAGAFYRGFYAAGSAVGAARKHAFQADANWDFGLHCEAPVYLTDGSAVATAPPFTVPLMIDSDPATFSTSSVICNAATNSSLFMVMSKGTIDNLATTNVTRVSFFNSGVLTLNVDDTGDALVVRQNDAAGTSNLLRLEDITGAATRLRIEQDGKTNFNTAVDTSFVSALRIINTWSSNGDGIIFEASDASNPYFRVFNDGYATMTTHSATAQPVLALSQLDTDFPLVNFGGTEAATQVASISTVLGDGPAIVGPLAKVGTSGWVFGKMIKIHVNGGDYYICAYQVAP